MSTVENSAVLYSLRPLDLVRFLGQLLDLEVHAPGEGEDQFLLRGEGLLFRVEKIEPSRPIPQVCNRPFNIEFSQLSELENLSRKVEFMEYRRVSDGLEDISPPLKFQKGRLGHRHFVWVCDPDGRSWQFFYIHVEKGWNLSDREKVESVRFC